MEIYKSEQANDIRNETLAVMTWNTAIREVIPDAPTANQIDNARAAVLFRLSSQVETSPPLW